MTLGRRSAPVPPAPVSRTRATYPTLHPPAAPPDAVPQGLSPQWAPAEHFPRRLSRAPTAPTPAPAIDALTSSNHAPPPTASADDNNNSDPDAAYRDLLHRVREEREQLGQLIDHPF
jgi:hypothetical protein